VHVQTLPEFLGLIELVLDSLGVLLSSPLDVGVIMPEVPPVKKEMFKNVPIYNSHI
jgi:hypothetical protein